MTELRNLVILSSYFDWDEWLLQIKSRARQRNVWGYVDLDVADPPVCTPPKEPELNIRVDDTQAKLKLDFEWKRYVMADRKYEETEKNLNIIADLIQTTVGPAIYHAVRVKTLREQLVQEGSRKTTSPPTPHVNTSAFSTPQAPTLGGNTPDGKPPGQSKGGKPKCVCGKTHRYKNFYLNPNASHKPATWKPNEETEKKERSGSWNLLEHAPSSALQGIQWAGTRCVGGRIVARDGRRLSAQPPRSTASPLTWHKRLGHLSVEVLKLLSNVSTGIKFTTSITSQTDIINDCKTCRISKAQRLVSREPNFRDYEPFSTLHFDLVGLLKEGFASQLHAIHSVESSYRFHQVDAAVTESEVDRTVIARIARAESAYNVRVRRRSLRLEAELPENLWREFYKTAAYIANHLPTRALGWKFPIAINEHLAMTRSGKLRPFPSLAHLRAYGCRVYVRDPNVAKSRKLDPRAHIGWFLVHGTSLFNESIRYNPGDPHLAKELSHKVVDLIMELEDLMPLPVRTRLEHPARTPEPYAGLMTPDPTPARSVRFAYKDSANQSSSFRSPLPPPPSVDNTPNINMPGGFSFDEPEFNNESFAQLLHAAPRAPEAQQPAPRAFEPIREKDPISQRLGSELQQAAQAQAAEPYSSYGPSWSRVSADLGPSNIIQGRRTRRPTRDAFHADQSEPSVESRYAHIHAAFAAVTRLHRSQLPPPAKNFYDLKNHEHKAGFQLAMEIEWEALRRKGTYIIIQEPSPANRKSQILPLKWVYTYKFDNDGLLIKHKARICVRGDLQPASEADNRSATLAARTLRLCLALAAAFNLEMKQFDAVNAFLHSPVLIFVRAARSTSALAADLYRLPKRAYISSTLTTETDCKKLDARNAKYRILERIGSHSYRLDVPKGVHDVFHVVLLRPASDNPFPSQRLTDYQPPAVLIPNEEGEPEAEWHVEQILQERQRKIGRGKRHEYLVKWTGYARPTWTEATLLEDTSALDNWLNRGQD
ncbi:hypothetical protein ACJ73_02992 [Blastomyces percursus]|uniref:Chromo domain-containing protein n=1 Tax=Blastomyces percursus TaxID=1658174 RepID=A0A1J9RAU2_9EURO|nr:hypothetical protein ACJ73_02992 [Blastomyces percursus]